MALGDGTGYPQQAIFLLPLPSSLSFFHTSSFSSTFLSRLLLLLPLQVHQVHFVYIEYDPTVRIRIGKDLFPICWLLFCPINSVLCLTERSFAIL